MVWTKQFCLKSFGQLFWELPVLIEVSLLRSDLVSFAFLSKKLLLFLQFALRFLKLLVPIFHELRAFFAFQVFSFLLLLGSV